MSARQPFRPPTCPTATHAVVEGQLIAVKLLPEAACCVRARWVRACGAAVAALTGTSVTARSANDAITALSDERVQRRRDGTGYLGRSGRSAVAQTPDRNAAYVAETCS